MIKFDEVRGQGKLYFLTEDHAIVPVSQAHSFIYKQKLAHGFREHFGRIVDPTTSITDLINAKESMLDEDTENIASLIKEYELDKYFSFTFKSKDVPVFIPKDYLNFAPATWYKVKRTKEQLASSAKKRQQKIYAWYNEYLCKRHIESLYHVKTTSVAWLYYYLHNENTRWKEGYESYGFVDGLFETGGYVTVAIDSGEFRLHTAVHELGHSMSYYLTNEMFDAWVKISLDKKEEPSTEYGKTDVAEDFAEAYGFYFSGDKSRVVLQKTCPNRFAYMQKLDSLGSKAMIPGLFEPTDLLSKRFEAFDEIVYPSESYGHIIGGDHSHKYSDTEQLFFRGK